MHPRGFGKPCCVCGVRRTKKNTRVFNQRGSSALRHLCRKCESAAGSKFRSENPDRALLVWARHRAKLKGVPFSITLKDVAVPKVCPVLGTPLLTTAGRKRHQNTPTLDRIDPAKGYVPGNVVVISWRANRLKSDATPDEIRRIANYVQKYNKGGK